MPTPSIRNPIRPARGNYSDLVANIADLHEGELCYAEDQDLLYVLEQGALQPVNKNSVTGSEQLLTNILNPQAGESLNYNGTQWVNGGVQDGGNF